MTYVKNHDQITDSIAHDLLSQAVYAARDSYEYVILRGNTIVVLDEDGVTELATANIEVYTGLLTEWATRIVRADNERGDTSTYSRMAQAVAAGAWGTLHVDNVVARETVEKIVSAVIGE